MTDAQGHELAVGIIAAHLADSRISWDKVARFSEIAMEAAEEMTMNIISRLSAEGFSGEEITLLMESTAGNAVGMIGGIMEARDEMEGGDNGSE
jgi:hypothetical protein